METPIKTRTLQLETISLDDLVKEIEARYGKWWRVVRLRRCLGCGKALGGRGMRTHECKAGWKQDLQHSPRL